jgi:L-fucose dehydrogenase
MDLNLDQKVIIVTGGSKGIGEGITRCIAEEGGIPVIVDRSIDSGEKVSAELKESGKENHFIHVELGDDKSCKKVVDEVVQKYDRIDGIVNNAGVNDGVGLESGNPEAFMKSVHNNLFHYYFLAHYSLEYLKKAQGAIVNISSKTAVTGQGNTSGYAAAKGAQLALTREWAVELLRYKIRVNAIVPAEVDTPQYKTWIAQFENAGEKLETINQRIPLGHRMTTKEEIAAMAVFLLSSRAAHITGQHLFVDGGYVHLDRSIT